MQEIADEFKVTRQWLNTKVRRWQESGIYQRASEIHFMPLAQEIMSAQTEILAEWPAILRHMLAIAKNPAKPRVAWEVTAWLEDKVVTPAMESFAGTGASENSYAEEVMELNPINIFPPMIIDQAPKAPAPKTTSQQ